MTAAHVFSSDNQQIRDIIICDLSCCFFTERLCDAAVDQHWPIVARLLTVQFGTLSPDFASTRLANQPGAAGFQAKVGTKPVSIWCRWSRTNDDDADDEMMMPEWKVGWKRYQSSEKVGVMTVWKLMLIWCCLGMIWWGIEDGSLMTWTFSRVTDRETGEQRDDVVWFGEISHSSWEETGDERETA